MTPEMQAKLDATDYVTTPPEVTKYGPATRELLRFSLKSWLVTVVQDGESLGSAIFLATDGQLEFVETLLHRMNPTAEIFIAQVM